MFLKRLTTSRFNKKDSQGLDLQHPQIQSMLYFPQVIVPPERDQSWLYFAQMFVPRDGIMGMLCDTSDENH